VHHGAISGRFDLELRLVLLRQSHNRSSENGREDAQAHDA
jgi:hypothetical protein